MDSDRLNILKAWENEVNCPESKFTVGSILNAMKRLMLPVVFLSLVFVGFGDKFLPEPLKSTSVNTRNGINQFVIGLFPNKKFKDPNQRTEDFLETTD